MANLPWFDFVLKEIDREIAKGKRMSDWDSNFLKTVRHRIGMDLGLTEKQTDCFRKLHERLTEIPRIKY